MNKLTEYYADAMGRLATNAGAVARNRQSYTKPGSLDTIRIVGRIADHISPKGTKVFCYGGFDRATARAIGRGYDNREKYNG